MTSDLVHNKKTRDLVQIAKRPERKAAEQGLDHQGPAVFRTQCLCTFAAFAFMRSNLAWLLGSEVNTGEAVAPAPPISKNKPKACAEAKCTKTYRFALEDHSFQQIPMPVASSLQPSPSSLVPFFWQESILKSFSEYH